MLRRKFLHTLKFGPLDDLAGQGGKVVGKLALENVFPGKPGNRASQYFLDFVAHLAERIVAQFRDNERGTAHAVANVEREVKEMAGAHVIKTFGEFEVKG